MIDNYRKSDGTLGFEYKPGKTKLKEVELTYSYHQKGVYHEPAEWWFFVGFGPASV